MSKVFIPHPLEFSKDYNNSYGSMKYLQKSIKISKTCRYNCNNKYNSLCVKLDEDSLFKLETISKWLDEYSTSLKIKDNLFKSKLRKMKSLRNIKLETRLCIMYQFRYLLTYEEMFIQVLRLVFNLKDIKIMYYINEKNT